MVELIDILNAIQGKDENGDPKSGVSITKYSMNASGMMKQNGDRSFSTPTANVIMNGRFILVDLVFPKSGAGELRAAWNLLKNFGENQNKHLDNFESDIFELTLIPLEYSGQYFCTFINPVFWSLQPSAPGLHADSIRMLFEKDSMSFLEGEKIDEAAMDKEIQYELREEQRINDIEEQRRIEREAYLDKMNEKFNHLDE